MRFQNENTVNWVWKNSVSIDTEFISPKRAVSFNELKTSLSKQWILIKIKFTSKWKILKGTSWISKYCVITKHLTKFEWVNNSVNEQNDN